MSKPRSIFEEVATTEKATPAATGRIDAKGQGARGAIRIWLWALFALVAVMILVGGLTRLTGSGLSITEWKPVVGAIPPMNAADWDVEFEKYQQIPQYIELNQGMTLGEFKTIYWWEWGHRQLGRFIGLVWALGFVGLWALGKIPGGWAGRLFLPGLLIGAQGALGWWMVHSGLQEGMLAVASYRLALHLGLAFAILGLLAWYGFRIARREADLLAARRAGSRKLFGMGTGLMHFAMLQILLGALVAGIDAGKAFPTWPLMGGGFFPPEPFGITPIWRNFFEDAGLVQFMHRCSGYLLAIYAAIVWLRARKSPQSATRAIFHLMLGLMLAQIVLGIVTVLHMAPLSLAISHQALALSLWVAIIRGRFLALYPISENIRRQS